MTQVPHHGVNPMQPAFAGIDVSFAKEKRLPIAVCYQVHGAFVPLPLRTAPMLPPIGEGNARILEDGVVERFAEETVRYLQSIEKVFQVKIERIAIDAPSQAKAEGALRRQCELGLDQRHISCITTLSAAEFAQRSLRARHHLQTGGAQSRMPAANQLWMLVGFALFCRLRAEWECLEVFPQAIAAVLHVNKIHKSKPEGLLAQLCAVSEHTGWPDPATPTALANIAYGSDHDKLDAYMSAWIASLPPDRREAIGVPPDDAIWVPRLAQ